MSANDAQIKTLRDLQDDAVVEDVAHRIIEYCVSQRSSDLFFAMEESAVMVSHRHMGKLTNIRPFSFDYGRRLINHIKAMAGIDLGDRHRPAEGRWIFGEGETDRGGIKIDLRINSIPTIHGEDLTIRLLDREAGLIPLEKYGLAKEEYEAITSLLRRNSGLILVTGPTGAGKSTTLYSCLQYLHDGTRKINTLEDPVEYLVKGIRQSQVNTKFGVGFAELLTACLRQSPDVIMIGEIRDSRTAATAVRAANSGHLVLATLHAPIAVKAIGAMVNLDVSEQSFSEGLLGVISQRLVPRLCESCRLQVDMGGVPGFLDDLRHLLPMDWQPCIYAAGKCEDCHESGYSQQICVPEILTLNNELRTMIAERQSLMTLELAARRSGMIRFRQSALWRVAMGRTTVEELMRVIPFDDLRESLNDDWSDELAPLQRQLGAELAAAGSR